MYDPTKPYKQKIFELIKTTWDTPYVKVEKNTYPIITKKINFREIDHTDGIGTKGIFHWKKRTFKEAALDALAMNLNDLALVGAVPYKLQNHIIIPKDDHEAVIKIIEALSDECKKRKIAITGGETSIHNNINGMDISICMSGFIKNLKPNKFKVGDVLIGIKSSGLHSNGFTKIQEIFGKKPRNEFIKPTKIYLDNILKLRKTIKINGIMHITGGAFSKLKDLLVSSDAVITREHKLKPQKIFYEVYNTGINDKKMYEIFNCGIGLVFSVAKKDVKISLALLRDSDVIGEISKGNRKVKILSSFSERTIIL